MESEMELLRLDNISKHYRSGDEDIPAVQDVSLVIEENESVAIIGPSGSGKSTLLNIMGLILEPDNGIVTVSGERADNLNDSEKSRLRNRTFGYVAQDFALIDGETVFNNIRIPLLYNRDYQPKDYKQMVYDAAVRFGIQDKLRRKAQRLSGGEKQRAAIARAVICGQPVILADEPTGSLDEENKNIVLKNLLKEGKRTGHAVVIVTHDKNVADQCDRVLMMENGRLLN